MFNKNKKFAKQISRLILGSFILNVFACATLSSIKEIYAQSGAALQKRPVNVTADQPNIWTLEQAHYLLAQMRRRNLDLKAKGLNPLDANEINGINIDVLRTLLEVGATYNEADKFNNGLLKEDKTFDAERRRRLIMESETLQAESANLAITIARLRREKANAEEDKKAGIEAQIVESTEIKAAKDAQIESKRSEISTLSPVSGTVSGTSGSAKFDASKFPLGGFDETFRKKAAEIIDGFKTNPQLNASLQLDNFLQLQYEIISKQLTLLRDEVGPGERLIFLELPQSVNATFDKSDDMWAQSRWRISGFSRCELPINGMFIPCHKILDPANTNRNQNRPSRTTLDIFDSVTNNETSVFDRNKLTLFNVKDREKIARRFVSRYDEQKPLINRLSFEQALTRDFFELISRSGKLNIGQNDIVDQEREYKETLSRLDSARKEVTAIEEKLLGCLTDNECRDKNTASLTTARTNLDKLEDKAQYPPVALLNLILKTLNYAIEEYSEVLNLNPSLNGTNQSRRNMLLSRINNPDTETRKLLNRLWIEDFFSEELNGLREEDFPSRYVDLTTNQYVNGKMVEKTIIGDVTTIKMTGKAMPVNNRTVRTVEMIPRQSSFNVNDVNIRNSSGAFNFIASFLFGFGANVNYQRQREKYSQFVQQELYSSAFGKGSREFGWTFTSMPGTDKLLSGLRTTYAIVIVPQEATSVVLESTGCAFNRDARQPANFNEATSPAWVQGTKNSCSEQKNFVIPIPGGGFDSSNDFFVSGMSFEPVEKGKRVVLSIYGSNFSSQIGVMVDGISLPESIGLAQRFLPDDSQVGKTAYEDFTKEKRVIGGFERVDSNQIIASFELVEPKDANPVITLISPGKAVDLNSIDLYINGRRNVKLKDFDWMFGKKVKSVVGAKDPQVFVSKMVEGKPTELTVLVTGSNFTGITQAFVNGIDPLASNTGTRFFIGEKIYQMKFPPPNDEKIQIVLVSNDETIKLDPMPNPAKAKTTKDPAGPEKFKVEVGTIIAYYNDARREKLNHLLIELTGGDLKEGLNLSLGQYDFSGKDSAGKGKAYITIPDPKPAQTIRITDPGRNKYFDLVVTLKDIKEHVAPLPPAPTPK